MEPAGLKRVAGLGCLVLLAVPGALFFAGGWGAYLFACSLEDRTLSAGTRGEMEQIVRLSSSHAIQPKDSAWGNRYELGPGETMVQYRILWHEDCPLDVVVLTEGTEQVAGAEEDRPGSVATDKRTFLAEVRTAARHARQAPRTAVPRLAGETVHGAVTRAQPAARQGRHRLPHPTGEIARSQQARIPRLNHGNSPRVRRLKGARCSANRVSAARPPCDQLPTDRRLRSVC